MKQKKYKYRFTLFTPCYNSALFIDRIKSSVENQTFKDFEWIVVNDNSTDNTLELLEDYIKTVGFPVKLINNQTNKMLAVNYNLAVEQTEGEYFVTLDHDDEYSPRYLERMNDLINKYDTLIVAGVVARCQTQYGKITPQREYTKPIMDWFEYGHDKNGRPVGEVPRVFKTEILKKYTPFDPQLVHNPLIEALMSYDGYKFITTNEVIRKYYVYENTHKSISNSRSSWLDFYTLTNAQNEINKYSNFYATSFLTKLFFCKTYVCSSIRCKHNLKEIISGIEKWKGLAVLVYPSSLLRVSVSRSDVFYGIWSFCKKLVVRFSLKK